LASQTRFFTVRWSCSITLLRYLHWRKATRQGMVPSDFSASTAAGYAGLSTFITCGIALSGASTAPRRKRLAAAVSRLAVSRKSIVCPVESIARYRYLSWPFTFIGLVDPITLVGRLQMRSAAFVQLGCIRLHPTARTFSRCCSITASTPTSALPWDNAIGSHTHKVFRCGPALRWAGANLPKFCSLTAQIPMSMSIPAAPPSTAPTVRSNGKWSIYCCGTAVRSRRIPPESTGRPI
jgi:hypothetical protein